MIALNTRRVVLAGLAAGVVLNVIDFIGNTFILGGRTQMELDAVNPLLWSALNNPRNIFVFVGLDFTVGILVVWLYAAIRPRYGAGPATALRAGVFAWLLSSLMWSFFTLMGIYSVTTFAVSSVLEFVNFVAAAWVGGLLYREAD